MRLSVIFISLCCSVALFAGDFTLDTIKIHSNILNEDRLIIVYKPVNLNPADSVTVIYLLDGEFSSYRYDLISKEKLNNPVVGIGIINTNRNRDMLPAKHPEQFLKFIAEEVQPKVEGDFLINQRILFGHSFAGGFTVYAMINNPGLFDKYIASSPTPIMEMIEPEIYNQLDAKLGKQVKFFIGYGSKDMGQVKKWSGKLTENLRLLKLSNILWKAEIFKGENHNTSDLHSLKKGLKF
jgi:predicted alpha/beta superfamily hydrolase